MSVIVETVLAELVASLVQDLRSACSNLGNLGKNSAREIEKWSKILVDLGSVLRNAEERKSEHHIGTWLAELEDLAYELEDLLEEFDFDIKHSEPKRRQKLLKQVKSVFKSDSKVSELQAMTARLKDLEQRKSRLNFLMGNAIVHVPDTARDGEKKFFALPVSGEPILSAREAEKKEIIDILRKPENEVGIIPIHGMGGIGKSTLARQIFAGKEIDSIFPVKAWVSISKDFDKHRILKCLVEQVTSLSCDFKELESLQLKLCNELKSKKFLIVFDDIWNLEPNAWHELCGPLKVAAAGSKLIVTTRSLDVANLVKTKEEYLVTLRGFSDNDCWSLFCLHVGSDLRKELADMRKNIVKKCAGLPLAVVVMAGLLKGKAREEDWKAILDDDSWISEQGQDKVNEVLKRSYSDLKPSLKSCFAFCCIFPEDYKFEREGLVAKWISSGLIRCDKSSKSAKYVEDMGCSYFDELVSRSLLIPLGLPFIYKENYVMHDLVRDMAQRVSSDVFCRLDKEVEIESWRWKRIKHLCVDSKGVSSLESNKNKMLSLRTFMANGVESLMEDDLHAFSKLRLLSIQNSKISSLPQGIAQMKYHLRYVTVSSCYFLTTIPSDIGSLASLYHLDISYCGSLTTLPSEIGNLVSLHYLNMSFCKGLTMLPAEIGNLVSLHHLDFSDCDSLIALPSEFGNLSNLRHLNMSCCRGLATLPSEIGNLTSLHHLKMSYCQRLTTLPLQIGNLRCLHHLDLNHCDRLTTLPSEIGNLANLRHLDMSWCNGVTILPVEVGNLASLHHLDISRCAMLRNVPLEMGNLANLHHLKMSYCQRLTALPSRIGNLSSLHHFDISDCCYLSALPSEIGNLASLHHLDISTCDGLTTLPSTIGNLSRLNHFNMSNCKRLTALPLDIGKLSSLSYLDISYCTGLITLPIEIGNLGSLYHLNMSNCFRLTTLPLEIGKLTSLHHLDIHSCNGLTTLPSNIGDLVTLHHLNMSFCYRLTTLPSQMGSLENLQHLDISSCDGLMALPREIENLVSLRHLNVSYCKRLTTLLQKIGKLASLNYLDISYCNGLTTLPSGIENLTSLRHFNMRSCYRLSTLPSDIGKLESLNHLDISYCNGLTMLPAEIGNLASLYHLNLSHCYRLSALPPKIENLASTCHMDRTGCYGLTTLP